jgi:tRNA(Ile)-lysidine synthase
MHFPLALQRLSPAAARLCLNVEHFLLRDLHVRHGARFVLAVSGGADSSALAVILHILLPRCDFALSAVTVNHKLRPTAAQDAAQAAALCARLGIACVLREADVAAFAARERIGTEEAGRKLRYAFLEEERNALHADFIALGHHSGDLTEDVLLRLVRGTGWPALGGMKARDDARHLLRPLLQEQPDAFRALLRECDITWQEDESNASLRHKRNRLRHIVLPLLRKENPSLDKATANLRQLARHDSDFWEEHLKNALAARPWQTDEDGLTLPVELLRALHPAARLRLYHKSMGYAQNQGHARARTLLALDKAWREGRGNTRFQLPGGIEARISRGAVRFCLRKKPVSE